ncbi:VOC family protein [Terrabacter sp. MAHUQ-38]|uniref:VOC family protein n=1 Tax=unclassified Terrabacter TaxID=2630222 RepID=UPI00165E8057|nr:VOC family protein [Terrabacter sp. MAHUQ-38]MBC9821544.1 VOC family protein [Terrabacter sp. MAHUQ-38]
MPLRTKKHWFGVVLDAPDASDLAHFYQRLLGWTLYKDSPGWATLAPDETSGYNLAFQQEPNYVRPVWPSEAGRPLMMLHLDLEVDDLEAATAYAVEVGAQVAAYQPQEDVRVMLDPAGHPFCLYLDPDDAESAEDR